MCYDYIFNHNQWLQPASVYGFHTYSYIRIVDEVIPKLGIYLLIAQYCFFSNHHTYPFGLCCGETISKGVPAIQVVFIVHYCTTQPSFDR